VLLFFTRVMLAGSKTWRWNLYNESTYEVDMSKMHVVTDSLGSPLGAIKLLFQLPWYIGLPLALFGILNWTVVILELIKRKSS
jgi:hypothetical protein